MTTRPMLRQLIESFVQGVAVPAITELENEAGTAIPTVVSVIEDGNVACRTEVVSRHSPSGDSPATGELRVKFREGSGAGRFVAQAIIRGLAEDTGFSGFAVRGKIELTGDPPTVRITGRSNRYNVWHWERELACEKGDSR